MNKARKINVLLLVLSVMTYIGGYIYWNLYCIPGGCSYDLRNEVLRPISTGSIYLGALFTLFLFFPTHYFKKWLTYIFSWGFPLVVFLTYITTGSSSIPAYGKVDVVKFWGVAFGVVTIIFVAFQYYRSRTKK